MNDVSPTHNSEREAEESRRCARCREVKPLSLFGKHYPGYTQSYCWTCKQAYNREMYQKHRDKVLERQKRYRKTPGGRRTEARATALIRLKHPEKFIARTELRKAVNRGEITKLPCEECGELRVEAHHYLGYEQEHWYDVKWLCRSHHWDVHQFSLRSRGALLEKYAGSSAKEKYDPPGTYDVYKVCMDKAIDDVHRVKNKETYGEK